MIKLRRYNKEMDGKIYPSVDNLYVWYNNTYKPAKVIATGLKGEDGDMLITIKDNEEDVTQRRDMEDFEFYVKDDSIRLKENDILTCGYSAGYGRWYKWVLCLDKLDEAKMRYKIEIGLEGNNGSIDGLRVNSYSDAQEWVRAANEKEIEILKKAALESTDKEVLNLANRLWMQPKFKPFDKVLYKSRVSGVWMPGFFSHYTGTKDYPYALIYNGAFEKVIPFEGNEHLLIKEDKE